LGLFFKFAGNPSPAQQNALWALGGVPEQHRSDSLSRKMKSRA